MSFFKKLFGIYSEVSDNIEILDKATFSQAISGKKVQLVDVRTQREFQDGHIAKAINIDLFQSDHFNKSFENLAKDQAVYLYCRSGARSNKAAKKLVAMGFKKVYDLKGGYLGWR